MAGSLDNILREQELNPRPQLTTWLTTNATLVKFVDDCKEPVFFVGDGAGGHHGHRGHAALPRLHRVPDGEGLN